MFDGVMRDAWCVISVAAIRAFIRFSVFGFHFSDFGFRFSLMVSDPEAAHGLAER